MKKIIAILLTLMMILTFCACGSKAEEAPATAGVANPWTDYASLEELNEVFGSRITKPGVMGVSNEAFSVLNTDESKIAQYNFEVAGYSYTLRFSPDFEKDISGIYVGDSTAFANIQGEANLATDEFKASRWLTVDGQYVLSVTDNNKLSADDFESIASELASLTIPEEAE